MSGTTNHDEAVADLPENTDDGKFFFRLEADDNGVVELKFRKQVDRLFGTVLFAMDYINQSFDTPFPTVGTFIRHLAEVADKIEEQHAARQQEAANDDSQGEDPQDAA